MNLSKTIKNELSGWNLVEVIWMALAVAIIVGISLYWNDTLMGIISSTTGVMYVICTGKGKLSAFLFGLINSVLYAIISFKASYYGETMLNALYYVPMQFVGFFVWSRNMNEETHEVNKKHMKNSGRIALVLSIAAGTYLYGLLLKCLGDAMPFTDSFTTVASVIAMIISVRMYSEQWWIWLVVDALSVYMWWVNFSSGSDNMATLLMWGVYIIIGVINLVRWEREIAENKQRRK